MSVRSSALLVVVVGSILSAAVAVEAQDREGVRCFALEIEDPAALYMLDGQVQGEVLVLTEESLEASPGVTKGARAYLGVEQWRKQEPLRPLSWCWVRPAPDSIRIGLVLPLWGIGRAAGEKAEGLTGEVACHSDVVGEPPRTSRFSAAQVRCEPADSSERF